MQSLRYLLSDMQHPVAQHERQQEAVRKPGAMSVEETEQSFLWQPVLGVAVVSFCATTRGISLLSGFFSIYSGRAGVVSSGKGMRVFITNTYDVLMPSLTQKTYLRPQ